MVLLPSLCHPDAQHAESSRNTSNWYASWITDKRSSMMSFVYVDVLVLSKVSWPAFLSGSIVIVCVSVHNDVCKSVTACVCACVNTSVFMSGCSFVFIFQFCMCVCECVWRCLCEWAGGNVMWGWGCKSLLVCANVFDAYCISALTGATVVLCFKLLVCLAHCFVWLRNGVNRGRGKQPGG